MSVKGPSVYRFRKSFRYFGFGLIAMGVLAFLVRNAGNSLVVRNPQEEWILAFKMLGMIAVLIAFTYAMMSLEVRMDDKALSQTIWLGWFHRSRIEWADVVRAEIDKEGTTALFHGKTGKPIRIAPELERYKEAIKEAFGKCPAGLETIVTNDD